MLVDKQNDLNERSFVYRPPACGDDVTWKPRIKKPSFILLEQTGKSLMFILQVTSLRD